MGKRSFYAFVREAYRITVPPAVRDVEEIGVGDKVYVTIEKVRKDEPETFPPPTEFWGNRK